MSNDYKATLEPQPLRAKLKPQQFSAKAAPALLVATKLHLGHTWGLVGDVSAIAAIPSLFVPLVGLQVTMLYGIRAKIGSGASIGVQVLRNGANVGGVITVTTAPATTLLGNLGLADGDELTLVLSSPVGTPSNFSATLILEQQAP